MSRHKENEFRAERSNDVIRRSRQVQIITAHQRWPRWPVLQMIALNEFGVPEGEVLGFLYFKDLKRIYFGNIIKLGAAIQKHKATIETNEITWEMLLERLRSKAFPSLDELCKVYHIP